MTDGDNNSYNTQYNLWYNQNDINTILRMPAGDNNSTEYIQQFSVISRGPIDTQLASSTTENSHLTCHNAVQYKHALVSIIHIAWS